jgi:hypothetical protein
LRQQKKCFRYNVIINIVWNWYNDVDDCMRALEYHNLGLSMLHALPRVIMIYSNSSSFFHFSMFCTRTTQVNHFLCLL